MNEEILNQSNAIFPKHRSKPFPFHHSNRNSNSDHMRKPEHSSVYRHFIGVLTLVFAVATAQAQGNSQNNRNDAANRPVQTFELDKANANYQVVERGANHRIWQKAETVEHEDGEEEEVIHSYTELSSGLNYWNEDAGAWEESRAVIEPHRGGAVAQFGQQKVIFANNLNTLGSVEILASDGVLLKASVLGLGYFDALSGKSVILAELKNSMGELIGDNQILYRDAFDGVEADVLYTYSLSGLEQDVILRENPPAPSEYGLPNLTTRLEVMTEWYDAPEPTKKARSVGRRVSDLQLRDQMAEPDLIDEDVSFGEVSIGQGRAFWQNQRNGEPGHFEVPVGKKWENINGRTFLFESVQYEDIETELDKLPAARQGVRLEEKSSGLVPVSLTYKQRKLPETQFSEPTNLKIAHSNEENLPDVPGFVIDYVTLSGSYSNYTFRGNNTYYLSLNCFFNGTTTIEGGTVIKYPSGGNYEAYIQGDLDCETDLFRPAFITAKDDNTVGQTISGSTGTPSGFYGWSGLRLFSSASAATIHDLIIRNTACPLYIQNGESANRVYNVKIIDAQYGVRAESTSDVELGNVLIDDCSYTAFYTDSTSNINGAHITLHATTKVGFTSGSNVELKNSLIVDVDTIYNYTNRGQSHNVELSNYFDAFQSVGSGDFYLKTSSIYRDFSNAATISTDLHDELRRQTTYPPGNVLPFNLQITSNTTLGPTVQRDSDTLDLGYHYPPIDVAVYYCVVSGVDTTLDIEPGTVVAVYGSIGFLPHPTVTINAIGEPLNPIVFVQYRHVQEQFSAWSYYTGATCTFVDPYWQNVGWNSELTLNMNYCLVTGGTVVNAFTNSYTLKHGTFTNSEFYNSRIFSFSTMGDITLKNNLFKDCLLSFPVSGPVIFTFFNNTMKGGNMYFSIAYGTRDIVDNVFEETYISVSYPSGINHHHNGYINQSSTFTPINSSDVTINGFYAWDTGPLGKFYHPSGSALIDAGSRSGGLAGLYYFTTTTNQVAEGSSTVDMGYHYHIVDASGNLIDSDGDLILDILEDSDGDGVIDPGETDPFNSENGTTGVSGLQVFFPF